MHRKLLIYIVGFLAMLLWRDSAEARDTVRNQNASKNKTQVISLTVNCTAAHLLCDAAQMNGTDWVNLRELFYRNLPVNVDPIKFETIFAEAVDHNQIIFELSIEDTSSSGVFLFNTGHSGPGGSDGGIGEPP